MNERLIKVCTCKESHYPSCLKDVESINKLNVICKGILGNISPEVLYIVLLCYIRVI